MTEKKTSKASKATENQETVEKDQQELPPDGAVEATEDDTTTHPEDDDPEQYAGDFVDESEDKN